MIFWFGDDWIRVIDEPTYRVLQYFQEGRAVEALPYIITDWSSSEPITLRNCMRLKASVSRTILNYMRQKLNAHQELDEELMMRYFKDYIKHPHSFSGNQSKYPWLDEIVKKYLPFVFLMMDHKGNVIHLPEDGGILDQPLIWLRILRAFKAAFSKYLQEESERQRRSAPRRR